MMALQDLALSAHVPIPSASSFDDPSAEVERYMQDWLHNCVLVACLKKGSTLCVSECVWIHARIITIPMFILYETDEREM